MSSEYTRLCNLIKTRETELAALKKQKKALDDKLLREMQTRKVQVYNGVKQEELVKKPRITAAEKTKMVVDLLKGHNVVNPEIVADELKKVGKSNK